MNPNWMTPRPWVEAARVVMGSIDLDPAASHEAATRTCQSYIYADGEKVPWLQDGEPVGNVFLNPPGGLWRQFLEHARLQMQKGHISQLFYVGYNIDQLTKVTNYTFPGKTTLVAVPEKRIRFIDPDTGNPGPAPRYGNFILLVLHPENVSRAYLHLSPACSLWRPFTESGQ